MTAAVADSSGTSSFPYPDGTYVSVQIGETSIKGWIVSRPLLVGGGKGLVSAVVVPSNPDKAPMFVEVTREQVTPLEQHVALASWSRVEKVAQLLLAAHLDAQVAQLECANTARNLEAVKTQHAQWVNQLVEASHRWANENELCGQFDEFMEEQGLPTRNADYVIEVSATIGLRLRLTRTARSESDAEDILSSEDVDEELQDMIGHPDFDLHEWRVVSAAKDEH